ncbi:MAG: 3-hydroxyacyl-ACP dehydratase FabZ [Deltaproteobacteria bacterium]|nr:3-hydroxyacyl-ACP dehydratase FabZ [Deltaproteobacteria bacterium]
MSDVDPEILAAIPHRPPFLFVDRIVSSEPGKLVAERTVRADEPHFLGHYPTQPIMPGVLLVEAALQAGCLLLVRQGGRVAEGRVPVVTRISDVKLKRMVKPGDVLLIEVNKDKAVMGVEFMRGALRVGGKVAATLSFAITTTFGSEP